MKSSQPAIVLGLSVLGLVAIIFALDFISPSVSNSTPASVSSINIDGLNEGPHPWDAATAGLRTRLDNLGLPALKEEGTELHIHQHLEIFVNGENVRVPNNIGVNQLAGFISPLHTHDLSGIIHVESPAIEDFTLGQFFGVWGVRLTKDCLGSYCEEGDNALKVFVNGEEKDIDPSALLLESHQQITLVYGTATNTPETIRTDYDFGPNL